MCSRSERVNPATTHCRMIKLPLLSHRAPVLLRECGRPFFVPARRPCFRVSGGCGSTFIINRYAFAVPFYLILGETTPGAYPMPFYAVRATTSLRGERAQQAAYSLPSLVGNEPTGYFPTISCARFFQHRSVQHRENVQCCIISQRGLGKKESGGLGEKTQKGKGDKHL